MRRMPNCALIGFCCGLLACVGAARAEQPLAKPVAKPVAKPPAKTVTVSLVPPPREIVCPGDELKRKWLRPMAKIQADIKLSPGPTPMDCTGPVFDVGSGPPQGKRERGWTELHWCPTDLYYRPLYFDDTPLERYGQTPCPLLQPAISAAHFFTVFPTLPYRMGIDGTCDRVYTLGYYRPGSPAPCLRQRLPFEWDAALYEAGAWVGGVFALP